MPKDSQQLRKQIAEQISAPIDEIERRIAVCLAEFGEFDDTLDAEDLALILRKVFYTLVGEQKVANLDVPIVHNVSEMSVAIVAREARIACTVHIHEPITAFIKFRYTLENHPHHPGTRLRLKNNKIEVNEVTRAFDVGAKVALKVLGVERIARHELSDPGGIIKRTLPAQLQHHGYAGTLVSVELQFTEDDRLAVVIVGKPSHT
jgi:hypothetical protein